MKRGLLSILACPCCSQEFTWVPLGDTMGVDECSDGRLECRTGHRFPVIAGVPRFLDEPLFSILRRRYREYFERCDDVVWASASPPDARAANPALLAKTIDRFGYEWTTYADYDADNFSRFLEPTKSHLGPAMTVLDAGCGAGRHLEILAETGVEVVGVDLSWAVDAAARRTARNPRIYVVQADLLRLPFRRSSFHFVYSLGVLHHLEDPAAAVTSLVCRLRDDGFFLAWVYMRTRRKVLLEPLRVLMGLLSSRGIAIASGVFAALEYGLLIGPYAWLCRLLGRRALPSLVPRRVQEYAEHGFRVSRVDWYDRLAAPISKPMTQDQATALLDLPELYDQQVTAVDDSWWQCYARVRR